MRRAHPLWRGFWLACLWTAALTLLGGMDWLSAFRGDRTGLTLALAAAAGAGLTALPSLFRRREKPSFPRWTRLLTAFLCGLAMVLACGMAGTGRLLPALMEGSTGAYAFFGTAAVTGFITVRLTGRRAKA